jgi:aquaporin Z
MKALIAEFLGTLWLVLGGCGSAIFAATFPETGIGFLGVALAFGLTVVTMAYAIGHISGCHLNPAVSFGLSIAGRHPWKCFAPYVGAQVLGAIAAGGILYLIASGQMGFDISKGFATNGYGIHSPGGYPLMCGAISETVLTAFFIYIILNVTRDDSQTNVAPIAIGLTLTLIHLISIPITNTSVNPARSTGVAVFQGGWALEQLWLFWIAPLAGGLTGALLFKVTQEKTS